METPANLPLSEYIKQIADGDLDPGDTGSVDKQEYIEMVAKLRNKDDENRIRCSECFTSSERTECLGTSFISKKIVGSHVWLEVACPYELDENGQITADTPLINVMISG